MPNASNDDSNLFVEEVELAGHIIDSLILPKILDQITTAGGAFRIKKMAVGQQRSDASQALLEVSASSNELLQSILAQIADHGAVPTNAEDCCLQVADLAGALPEGFYATTNQRSEVRLNGKWIAINQQEMDCGVVVDTEKQTARCLPMTEVQPGMQIVVGHRGTRVFPLERQEQSEGFAFMQSAVSTEKPKAVIIKQIARELFETRKSSGKTLLVGGPAIVHTGSSHLLAGLIEAGYIDILFAGNALAAHDIEQAMFGTSLGVYLNDASLADAGHEHHLRAINHVRRRGSIRKTVEAGDIKSGIMFECIKHNVDFLLSGSIRDDGPLPDVVTDSLENQQRMREMIPGVSFCLMVATTLHSIATGNLLPASVKVVCIDINPSTVIKLNDRGSFQTVGLVTDVEPFFRELVGEIHKLEAAS